MFISFSLLLDQFSKFLNHSKAHTNFGHFMWTEYGEL